ncbi:MAG: tRNA pseudouridine(55) synthase TruB [Clostridia bacterium]|nr:tRNA pseudouridine(55) synthase TruB [Clostridia bacterium]
MAYDGIVSINKPAGISSFKCVSAVRRITGCKKTGHAGTLDPEATGVLPVCVGKATKCSEFFLRMGKSYRAEMLFGLSTNTMDIWGEPISENYEYADRITEDYLLRTLELFKGEIEQIPPAFSAIKKDGVPLYKLARKGIEVKPESRKVTVYKIKLISFFRDDEKHIRAVIDVHCSKGTYIRSICNDIGEKLGIGACMSSLVRTSYGPLSLKDSVSLEEFEKAVNEGRGNMHILEIESLLEDYPRVELNNSEKEKYIQGKKVFVNKERIASFDSQNEICVYFDGKVIAISEKEEIENKIWLKPYKFFGE